MPEATYILLEMEFGENSEEFTIIRDNSAYFMDKLYLITLRIHKLLDNIKEIVDSSYVKRE